MRKSLFIVAFSCAVVTGCSRSDDFSAFVVTEVGKYGGHSKTNVALPKLAAEWKVEQDRNGFQASVTGCSFAKIDALMEQAFGTPKVSGDGASAASDQPHRVWRAADIGCAIWLVGRTNGAEIICVRAMRDVREMFQEEDKPWWKFW